MSANHGSSVDNPHLNFPLAVWEGKENRENLEKNLEKISSDIEKLMAEGLTMKYKTVDGKHRFKRLSQEEKV